MSDADPFRLDGAGSPENAIAVQQLAAALAIARGGMSFIFAVCNSVPLRQRILAELGPRVPGALTVELTGAGDDAFDAALAAAGETRPPAIFIGGLDFPLPDDEPESTALTAFNASRELWWSRFSCPVVFFLSEAARLRVMRGAPDLWSRKSHVFEFAQPQAALMPVTGRPASDLDDDIARWPVARREARLIELQARIDRILDDASDDERRQRLRWRNESGHIHLAMQRRVEAVTAFDAAAKEAEAIGDLATLGANATWAALVQVEMGNLLGAANRIDAAIHIIEATELMDSRTMALLLSQRARIRQAGGLLKEADDDIGRSIAWEEQQALPNQRELAIRYASRASIRQYRGDLQGAEADLNRAIGWFESQNPLNGRGVVFLYEDKALLLARQGRFAEAQPAIDESVRLHIALFGTDHEWTKTTIAYQQAIHAGKVPG